MSGGDQGRAEILRCWRTVELFTPARIDPVDPRNGRVRVDEGPLPWAVAGTPLKRGEVRRHVVHVGVFALRTVGTLMEEALGAGEGTFVERPDGESALAAFVVGDEGLPDPDSAVLSSCAWAVGQILGGEPGAVAALEGFEDAAAQLREALQDAASEEEPLDQERLRAIIGAAATAAGVGDALGTPETRVRTVVTRADADVDVGMFNSFHAADLSRVADAVAGGDAGAALLAYLQTEDAAAANRIDVRADLTAVAAAVAPGRLPLGRWPSAPDRPAALGQQMAVGEALALMRDDGSGAGLIGVNGPPGTGKTTLVRDLIAAIVVARAEALATLDHPRDAFVGPPFRWQSGEYRRVVQQWRPELTGFEIVVASANNGAVENITHDIPGAGAVDPGWRAAAEAADGFAELAGSLIDADAWGLIAARLGRLSYRGRFAARAIRGFKDSDAPESVGQMLARLEREPPPEADWDDAVASFRRARNAAAAVRADRERAADAQARRARIDDEIADARKTVDAAERRATAAGETLATATREAGVAEQHEQRRRDRRTEHQNSRPGAVERLTSLGRAMRAWRERDDALAAELGTAESVADGARDVWARAVTDADDATRALTDARDRLASRIRTREDLDTILAQARTTLGDAFPGEDWFNDDRRELREQTAPWTDPTLDRARTEVFLAALALHRAFLAQVPREMRQSLHGAADVLSGAAPSSLPEDAARAAWHALFFLVPVVSTTFASLSRMFSHLGREALGWLIVDEGGQASPQDAAGALWRARRAVVLGDPRQLTPVDTLSCAVQEALADEHGIDHDWVPRGLSVQRLADRATPLGTWLSSDDGADWIGTPLTVHRRCDRPIFEIVNAIAYDNLMVYATDPAAGAAFDAEHPGLPPSKWINVPATDPRGHWIPRQGEEVEHVLAQLSRRGVAFNSILVVSPFRAVADELRRLPRQRRYRGLIAGTVHTAQGREADVVLVVLGGNPKSAGARRWASETPNLLNVALSRARRRLYVIGDHEAWSDARHFDVLAARLERHEPVVR
ncbi:DEAD/DEAH box helicase [Baekduia sp. Peel2402]|uniref:DEAD/DEAH box helicase n=1 Tax=Baekduia sp. Peel2402 TaxID=3458296 RepID=UPI00403E3AAB